MDNQFKKFETWISGMFAKRLKHEVCYHDLTHTRQVVKKVGEICGYYKLTKEEQEDLFYAAWLHDVGYWDGESEGHEERGAKLSQEWLTEYGLPQERIDRVKSAILATKVPQHPQNLVESIICDADLYHLSSDEFYEKTILLKKERENILKEKLALSDWLKGSQSFMRSHHFHTDYAKSHMQQGKEKNLELLKVRIKKAEAKESKSKSEKSRSVRGVETMFRMTSANHLQLSALADNKANIMISVNSIIISIVVTILIRKLEEFPIYTIPTVFLISTCLAAMVFAILATRPKVTKGVVTKDDIIKKQGNLLYFGNFFGMSLPEYKQGMHALMDDGDYLYDSMITDIYHLGSVLNVKYKMLRRSYNIFMFGFVISIILFMIASLFFEPLQY